MTDNLEPKPTVSPPSPLSVVLLAQSAETELEQAINVWLEFLRGLKRPFEVILVADPGLPFRVGGPEQNLKIVHPSTAGLGASLRAGLAEAKHPLIFFTMADKRYQPGDLPTFLERIEQEGIDQVHLVSGLRLAQVPWWLELGGLLYRFFCQVAFGLPVERRLSWLGWSGLPRRLIARWLFGIRLSDPECVYCLCRREILARIPLQSQGSFAPVEFLAKANFTVPSGTELPVKYTPAPTQPLTEGPSFFREALQVFRHPDFGPPQRSK